MTEYNLTRKDVAVDGIEKTYIIKNSTTGSFTVQIKTTSGTGPVRRVPDLPATPPPGRASRMEVQTAARLFVVAR